MKWHSRLSLALCVALLWSAGCGLPPLPVQPAPQPVPVVKVDSVWVIAIDDWAMRTKDTATRQLLGDGDYWAKLKARGHKFSVVDAGDSAAYQRQMTEAGGLPCVILLNAATLKELAAIKLPGDAAGLDALVKRFSDK